MNCSVFCSIVIADLNESLNPKPEATESRKFYQKNNPNKNIWFSMIYFWPRGTVGNVLSSSSSNPIFEYSAVPVLSDGVGSTRQCRTAALQKIRSCGSVWVRQRSLISFFTQSNQVFLGLPLILREEIFISLAILMHEAEGARSLWPNHLVRLLRRTLTMSHK